MPKTRSITRGDYHCIIAKIHSSVSKKRKRKKKKIDTLPHLRINLMFAWYSSHVPRMRLRDCGSDLIYEERSSRHQVSQEFYLLSYVFSFCLTTIRLAKESGSRGRGTGRGGDDLECAEIFAGWRILIGNFTDEFHDGYRTNFNFATWFGTVADERVFRARSMKGIV